MKRILFPLIAALAIPTAAIALPSAVNAGVPESRIGKWVVAIDTPLGKYSIDTEDIEIKGSKMRFWVARKQGLKELSDSNKQLSWRGKMRIDCKDFTLRIDLPTVV